MKIIQSIFAGLALFAAGGLFAATPANLTAQFRSGQVFLTWTELAGASGYAVYCKQGSALDAGDLTPANCRIKVIQGSAGNKYLAAYPGASLTPAFSLTRNVIDPLVPTTAGGQAVPVPAGMGMVVLTTHAAGTYYYAVTALMAGAEDLSALTGNTVGPIDETVQKPEPVLIYQTSLLALSYSKGQVYLQYTDIERCNLSYSNMYAWPVWISASTVAAKPMPLQLLLSGFPCNISYYGVGAWSPISVAPAGMSDWWMGWSRTAAYDSSGLGVQSSGVTPTTGPVVNFIGARTMDFLEWVIHRSPEYAGMVDTNQIFTVGRSAGGGGSLLMTTTYPDFFAYGTSDEGPTNYLEGSWVFNSQCRALWGMPTNDAITMEFEGWQSDYAQAKFNGMTAHAFLNTAERLKMMEETDLPYLNLFHGGKDGIVDWPYQGKDLYTNLNLTRQGFNGTVFGWAGHGGNNWPPLAQLSTLRRNESYPAISNTHGNAALPLPDNTDTGKTYLLNAGMRWSSSGFKVGGVTGQIDLPDRYEIVIADSLGDDTADVTPRRLQLFQHVKGASYLLRNTKVTDSSVVYQRDTVVSDSFGLITFNDFQIMQGTALSGGSRLIITPLGTVATERKAALAASMLFRCYPEPFNPGVTIDISGIRAGNKGPIIVSVYGMNGQCYTVMEGKADRVVWNASHLPSGVYSVKVSCGSQTLVKRVTLIK